MFYKSSPVHVLQMHVLQIQSSLSFTNPIQSIFYKSNPVYVLQYAHTSNIRVHTGMYVMYVCYWYVTRMLLVCTRAVFKP